MQSREERCVELDGCSEGCHLTVSLSVLLQSLAAETHANPFGSKRLVGPDVNYGRELLVSLARHTGGWIGWEATNLRMIAGELAFAPLHVASTRVAGDIEIRIILNRALDAVLEARLVTGEFGHLARSHGFRQALRDSVLELRMAGVTSSELERSSSAKSPARQVAVVLREYEGLLTAAASTDPAGVFRAALDNFDVEAPYCLKGEIFIAPVLVKRGLPGELLERLITYGARVIAGDGVAGLDPPARSVLAHDAADPKQCWPLLGWTATTVIPSINDVAVDRAAASVEMFCATTPLEELREILRRALAEGLRWDDVEIVTPDTDTYGVALDVVCQLLEIGASLLHGIPLARTRLGRAFERWLGWLENDLSADVLRQALEAGDIGLDAGPEPSVLAKELRAQRIGWGRPRYEAALLRLGDTAELAARTEPNGRDDDAAVATRAESRRGVAAELHSLLSTLLRSMPRVPERGSDAAVSMSVSQLATAALAWLSHVNLHGQSELQTAERIRVRLESLVALDGETTTFSAAVATLRDAMADVRAWPLDADDSKPWRATGGKVHLTDIIHAGTTGRARIFVAGLSADATAGSGRQDPLVPDALRAVIGAGSLTTTAQRRDERAYYLSAALASLRGRVTLSYALNAGADGSAASPASVVLQAHRLLTGNAGISYSDLRASLSPPVCAVPLHGSGTASVPLDARDVWLGAVADDEILLDGEALVRASFKSLDVGLSARALAFSKMLTPFTGLVEKAAGELDPRNRSGAPISPSSLEKLAACPLAWFYHYGLRLRPPEDPRYDPEAWLDFAQRGKLLHEVFETFATQFGDRRVALQDAPAEAVMMEIVDSTIERWAGDVPAHATIVFKNEVAELRRAAKSFLEMERKALSDGDAGTWRYFEFAFGFGDHPAGAYQLTDGTSLRVRGRVDRIDVVGADSFRVIDYKTGKLGQYARSPGMGKFNGGRQLQPAIYAGVLDALLGGTVTRFEYRFPTERGRNATVAYTGAELSTARSLVTDLLDHTRDGEFIPTNDSDDCKYCDAGAICRVSADRFGKVTSPRAEWAEANAADIDAYQNMLARRTRQVPS